jgi:hypothetical protein
LGSAAVALAAILWLLTKQLRLQREDVIQDPIYTPTFQTVVRDDPGSFEVPPQQCAQGPVDARATSHLGLFEKL